MGGRDHGLCELYKGLLASSFFGMQYKACRLLGKDRWKGGDRDKVFLGPKKLDFRPSVSFGLLVI